MDTHHKLAFALTKITDTILPHRCVLCRDVCEYGFCTDCSKLLPWIICGCAGCGKRISSHGLCGRCQNGKSIVAATLVPFVYEPPISEFIISLKYSGQLFMAASLGKIFSQYVISSATALPEALLPIPLHPKKLRSRGFNQSYELARIISKQLDIPVITDALIRHTDTPSQTGLSGLQRRRNVRSAFSLKKPIHHASVAIIDDVITSGSTLQAVARAIQKGGVKKLSAWAIATT